MNMVNALKSLRFKINEQKAENYMEFHNLSEKCDDRASNGKGICTKSLMPFSNICCMCNCPHLNS